MTPVIHAAKEGMIEGGLEMSPETVASLAERMTRVETQLSALSEAVGALPGEMREIYTQIGQTMSGGLVRNEKLCELERRVKDLEDTRVKTETCTLNNSGIKESVNNLLWWVKGVVAVNAVLGFFFWEKLRGLVK